jgi:patatin-like phospholipase/acyl hydrolase
MKCPFHKSSEAFSPRILPVQSGFRILSLDGGGVKGIAQLAILRRIEKDCFGIPATQLFDLIVGTNVGGQIALALTTPTHPAPLTVDSAAIKFRELLSTSHVCAGFAGFFRKFPFLRWALQMCTYDAEPLQSQLQSIFGHDVKLCGAMCQSSPPHVAVTSVSQTTLKAYILAN